MQRKKIIHLITGLEIGGTETQLLRILPKLQKYYDNYVCCVRGHGPIGIELEKESVPVFYLDLKNIVDILVIKRFYSVIKKVKPEILVTYLIHADLYGRFFGKLFGIKKIISSKRGHMLQWEWLAFFDRLTKWMVKCYLVQTETAKKEWMARLNLPENKFKIIPNAIEFSSFDFKIDKNKKKAELKINPDNLNIVCVGSLHVRKGHQYLLEAFEEVFCHSRAGGNPVPHLLLVGDGEEKENLLRQIENYDSKNNILFLGKRTDVPQLLKISDIFVLPTLTEGMSNAIMEAMICGLPVITTDIPENRELIENNQTGILTPVRDSASIQENILLLLKDETLRKRLGEKAKDNIRKKCDINIVLEKMRGFYNSL